MRAQDLAEVVEFTERKHSDQLRRANQLARDLEVEREWRKELHEELEMVRSEYKKILIQIYVDHDDLEGAVQFIKKRARFALVSIGVDPEGV